jgi:hypothetical protein
MFIKSLMIGMLCYLSFAGCNRNAISPNAQIIAKTPTPKNVNSVSSNVTPTPAKTPNTDFDSSELDKLESDTFPYGEKISAPNVLVKQILAENRELRQCFKEEYKDIFSEFGKAAIAESPDLNEDGKSDFIVRVANKCSGQNSPTFVYQTEGKRLKRLLSVTSNGVKLKKSKTNGFYDLSVSSHTSCCSGAYRFYKFEAGQYKTANCYIWETIKTEDGKEKAKVKPDNCNQ